MKNQFSISWESHKRFNFLLGLILIIFAIVSFMAPAIWNGFPLIFTDSLSYLTSGIELVAPVDRPIFYGLFLRLTNFFYDLWGAVFCQAVLISFLLMKFAKVVAPDFTKVNSATWVLVSSVFSTAPWFSSQISPDIFTSCLFLTYLIWIFSYKNSSILNTAFLGLMMIALQCMHSGNIFIGLILYIFMLPILIFQKAPLRSIKKFSLLVLISLGISTVLIVTSNIVFHQGLTFNRWGKIIFLARILEDGPALKYLKVKCIHESLSTCAALPLFEEAEKKEIELGIANDPELKNMVLNALLWDGGINKIGGLHQVNSEASNIIFETLLEYPKDVLIYMLKNTLNQLKTFTVGSQFGSTSHLSAMNNFIEIYFPEIYNDYTQSLQFQNKVKAFITYLNPLYKVVVYLSAIYLFILLIKSCRFSFNCPGEINKSSLQILILSLFGFMVANAAITGGISAVFDRYQGRVIWLVPAISFLLLGLQMQKINFLNSRVN